MSDETKKTWQEQEVEREQRIAALNEAQLRLAEQLMLERQDKAEANQRERQAIQEAGNDRRHDAWLVAIAAETEQLRRIADAIEGLKR